MWILYIGFLVFISPKCEIFPIDTTAVFFSQQAQLLSSALANFLLPRKCYWPRANEMSKGKKTTLWARIGQAMWAPQCMSTVGGLEGVNVISIKTGGNEHWNSFKYHRLHIEKYIYFYDMHIYLFVTFYYSCCFCFIAPMLGLLILRSKCFLKFSSSISGV